LSRRQPFVALGGLATLKVERGALVIRHKPDLKPVERRFDLDDEPPHAILFDARGEWLSGEALRWCARRGVVLVIPDGPGRMMTFVHSALEASEGAAAIADINPATIMRQCAIALDKAARLAVAKRIVAAKIEAEYHHAASRGRATFLRASEWMAKTETARTIGELLIVEAKAAADYWRAFSDLGLREMKGGNLPRSWLRFANRNRGAQFLGNKHAGHPINAMLNYAYVTEAGRLAKALHARGLALQVGFLHSDKRGRNSLVWDAIEPLRPAIDARVFAFIERREFCRSDFKPAIPSLGRGTGVLRLDRALITDLLSSARLARSEIDEASEFLIEVIWRASGFRTTKGKADVDDR
jgi:CRISP-associated protein Cas1